MTEERQQQLLSLARLIRSQRWAALASIEPAGAPYASAVAYVAEPEFSGFLLHLSGLAPHTRNLLQNASASLLITEPDCGEGDPQTLPRVSLLGEVAAIPKTSPHYAEAEALYLKRLPSAAPLFTFPDFTLFRLTPSEARFVGGFARARRFDASGLREASRL